MNYCEISSAGCGGIKRRNSSISGNNATGGEQRSTSYRRSHENNIGSNSEGSAQRGCGGAQVTLKFEDFFNNDDAVKNLLTRNNHLSYRASLPHEKSTIGLFVSQLDANNIQAHRSNGNGSETNPHTHRCSFTIKGFISSPYVDYYPVLTDQGQTFIQQFNEKSFAFHIYSLIWQYEMALESLIKLIDFHCDQSRFDIDATGGPNKFINREVLCSGMKFKLLLKMSIVWYDEGKVHKRKIAGCEIELAGDCSYCMDAVASGRHTGYKMIVPSGQIEGVVGGKPYDIIIQHATKRVDTNASVNSRIIINKDYRYDSAADAAAGMDAFTTGIQDSADFRDWVTRSVNQVNTSSARIGSIIKSLSVHEPGDKLWCRSCANAVTCVDKRPLPLNVVKNNNNVSLIQGSVITMYWYSDDEIAKRDDDGNITTANTPTKVATDEKEWNVSDTDDGDCLVDKDLSDLAYVGVITHVVMEGNRVTSVDVTFVEEGDDQFLRSHWKATNMDEMNYLYPADQEDIVKLLGNRHQSSNNSIHRSTLCDTCAIADPGLMATKFVNLLENPCKLCCKDDILPRCSGCANCLGNPTCRGVPGDGDTRIFYCAGIDENAEVGVTLTVANCTSGSKGYICHQCSNVEKHGVRKEKQKYKDMADYWQAFFTAVNDHPTLYTHQSGTHVGSPNLPALFGEVDDIDGIPLLMQTFNSKELFSSTYHRYKKRNKIPASPNCTSCVAGTCDVVGKSVTTLDLFIAFRDHSCGVENKRKSRFDDID
ncbi:hypothetical protein ACHAWC_010002 [Mediolabrus comicus]